MANFGKLNFAVAFAPQTAFPLDARYYFTSLEAAQAAAASSVEVGSSNGTYFYGENVVVVTNDAATLYLIQPDKTLKEVGSVSTGDNRSIEVIDGKISIKGFGTAEAGSQLVIGDDGNVTWVKPDTTTVEGLSTKVATLEESLKDKTSKTEVAQLIAESGHAKFEKVDSIPSAAEAKENVLYLVMNAETGFYDIWAKIDEEVVRLDDVSVNLDNYATKEELNGKVDKIEGSRLITSDEVAKLQSVETGAQVNFIKTVDASNFSVINGKLTLTAISQSQVTDLEATLATKADTIALQTVEGKIDALETKTEKQGKDISNLQTTVGILSTDLTTAKSDISTLNDKVAINETDISNLQATIGKLDNTYVKIITYNTEVGDISQLIHHAKDDSTIVEEINDINERLTWADLAEK